MSAIELFHDNGKPAGIYYCSECRVVYRSQDDAQWCHQQRVCACGNTSQNRFHAQCDDCEYKDRQAKEFVREQERFEKATKIEAKDYDEEGVFIGDNFYESVEDAIDSYLPDQVPEYVWAAKNVGVRRIDIEDVLTRLLEDMWEDADTSDLYGTKELDDAINAFNKANEGLVVWNIDDSRAVLVPEEYRTGKEGE